LSNAVAITLYVIATASVPAAEPESPPAATRETVERLEAYWFATLERFQYFRRTDPEIFRPLFRKFLGRQHLSDHDAQILRGMLSQFNLVAFNDRFDGKPPRRGAERNPVLPEALQVDPLTD
jgi:tRNA C32,U32 (ribose-2'-O)-methylase TrmJ